VRVIWHGPWSGMRRDLALLVMGELALLPAGARTRTSPCCSAACASDQAAGDGAGAASAMRRTGRNAVREARARVERCGPKRSTAPPPDSYGGAGAVVGQPTPWTMCSGSVPPRGASGKRLSRKR
jgi:hypothetical protein